MNGISIVIPHLRQWQQLHDCLASLHAQTLPRDRYEIIVIDNGSTDFEAGRQRIVDQYPDVIMGSELTPGPGPARNRGISRASFDMIACIDADCIADNQWVEAAFNALTSTGPGTIHGGDVRIAHQDAGAPTALEAYEAVFGFRQKLYITKKQFSGTGNLAFWKSDFHKIGPFAGITLAEDMDWGRRSHGLGMKLIYNPGMIVYHPARKSMAELQSKWSRQIAHELSMARTRRNYMPGWVIKALAVAVSFIPHLALITASKKLTGLSPRIKAAKTLVRIRLYRAREMLGQMMSSDSEAHRWNR